MLVSIICVTYNHEDVINRCIDSVLVQTFPDWELIIVDDGSTDNTGVIVDNYSQLDDRIKVIHQGNNGAWKLCDTYNTALAHTKGELIAILEGDDFWPEWKLKAQVELNDSGVILSYGRATIYDGTYRDAISPPFHGQISSGEFLKYLVTRKAAVIPVTLMINSYALKKIGGFKCHPDYPATDFPTILELSRLSGKIVWSPMCLGYYRIHNSQITNTMGVEIAEGAFSIKTEFFLNNPQFRVLQKESTLSDSAILGDAYLARIRYGLIAHNKATVRASIRGLWKNGGTKRKLQAIYSFVAIYVGWDMEFILKLASSFDKNKKDFL